jgi:choline dehydrogenase-like flavoprotein
MRIKETDVLIIGSGFGGAAPALRLSRAGWKVAVLEKGPRLDPYRDFKQTQDPRYLLKYLKGKSGKNLNLTYAEALGGGSGFYEMVSLRAPSMVFEQVDENGERMWPDGIDRASFDPYYEVAEKMLRVRQLGPGQVPKTGLVFSLMMRNLGYSCDRARYAVKGCLGTGYCVTGCIFGAKQSLLVNYLPKAEKSGAVIETDLNAERIIDLVPGNPVHEGAIETIPYRYEVRCKSQVGGEPVRYRCRVLILSGGTVGTAELLLKSRAGLGRLSSQVGRNIGFNGSIKMAGLLPEGFPSGDNYTGLTHPGMVSYQFMKSHGAIIAAGKALPLQAVAAARLRLRGDGREPLHWGEDHVALMKQFRERVICLVAFGLSAPTGVVRLGTDGELKVELNLTDSLRAYHHRLDNLLRSIFERNGCRVLDAAFVNRDGSPYKDIYFASAHQMGSCRMSDSPRTGVTDAGGEVHGYSGLYVTDGASIPSSLAVNSSLTILANAERIAAGILSRHGSPVAVG